MHSIYQNGKEVYRFAVKALTNALTKAAEKLGLTTDDIDIIIETAAKALNVSMDKMFITLDKYGNTSSASIPIALDTALEQNKIKSGDKLCLVGFGAGLTTGAVIMEY